MDLILNTYGTSIKREDDCFVVESSMARQKISPVRIDSIIIHKGILLSSDAIMLAVKNEIPIIIIEDSGKVNSRLWSPKYGSISTIRKGQLAFSSSSLAISWLKELIVTKMDSQKGLLLLISNYHSKEEIKATQKIVGRINKYIEKVQDIETKSLSDAIVSLRAYEAAVAKIYFAEINKYIPEKLRFEERSQHPARDIANAFLNYGYAILYGKVETALIKAGIDPYIGIMHRDDYNKPALVFDFIEPYRVWIDYIVINLMCQLDITEEYYSVDKEGGCWLEAMGRKVLIQAINDYLDESTRQDDRNKTRLSQLQDKAYKLAKIFLNTKSKED